MTADYRLIHGIIVLNTNEVSQDYVKCVRTSEFGPSYTPYVVVNYTSS